MVDPRRREQDQITDVQYEMDLCVDLLNQTLDGIRGIETGIARLAAERFRPAHSLVLLRPGPVHYMDLYLRHAGKRECRARLYVEKRVRRPYPWERRAPGVPKPVVQSDHRLLMIQRDLAVKLIREGRA